MFYQHYPRKALVSRFILLHVQLKKRLVTMSIPDLSEESSNKRLRDNSMLQINEDRSVLTSSREGENSPAARKFTEEELAIHRSHREACEVRCITSKTSNRMGHVDLSDYHD